MERKNVLAEVLADYPRVVVIEDDHFAGAATVHPGSLLADSQIEDRVIYIRSFSKTMGPDLRLAVAVARPRLRALIADAKSFTDGWSPRLAQRALAHALADRKLDEFLADACRTYAERRAKAAGVLHERLAPVGGRVWGGADGVNIWVQLPPDVNATQVIEQTAAGGVLAASGEPFFIRPGHGDAIRLNAGAVSTERAFRAGEVIAAVALTTVGTAATVIAV